MSKAIYANQYASDREYDEAKKRERKADQKFREVRKGRKGVWVPSAE
jgi:hypothetical protein